MTAPRRDRFFIAGCQRSGTTLLRLVLECHPDIFCLDEDTSYPALMRGDCPKPRGERLTGFKVPRWAEQLGEPLASDEGQAETAEHFYRGEPVVYLMRDARDVVASMQKLKMAATQTWLEFCARPILEAKLRQPAFAGHYAAEVAKLRSAGDPGAMVGALYWKYKTAPVLDYRRRGWPVLLVRYEDLVRAPRRQLRRITRFLGLPWDGRLLRHPEQPHAEIYPDGTAMGNTDPRRPIGGDAVGQWRRHLSPGDEDMVWAVAGDLMARLGYRRRTLREKMKAIGRGLRTRFFERGSTRIRQGRDESGDYAWSRR
jgi:hypothetical protein